MSLSSNVISPEAEAEHTTMTTSFKTTSVLTETVKSISKSTVEIVSKIMSSSSSFITSSKSRTEQTTTSATFETTSELIEKGTTIPIANGVLLSDANLTLADINAREVALLTPVTVYICLLMVVGIIGNILVLYVYKYKFKRSNTRNFILSLAFVDMLTCCIGMPYHIIDLMHPVTFYSGAACKFLSLILIFTTVGSIFLLDLIAVDRYRKICKPLKKQISRFGTKKACIICIVASLFISWPTAILYGRSDVYLGNNITGAACFMDDNYADTIFPLIYDGILFIMFVASTVTLIVLYTLVVRKIFRQHSFQDNLSNAGSTRRYKVTHDTQSVSVVDESSTSEADEHTRVGQAVVLTELRQSIKHGQTNPSSPSGTPRLKNKVQKDSSFTGIKPALPVKVAVKRLLSNASATSGYDTESESEAHQPLRATPSNATTKSDVSTVSTVSTVSRRQRRTVKITVMMFIITIVFIISFLPHLVLLLVTTLYEEFWNNLNDVEKVVYDLLLRTYFINNMANPIIYGLWDMKFRLECSKLGRTFVRRLTFKK